MEKINLTNDIDCQFGFHRNHEVIYLKFEYDPVAIQELKKSLNAKWSNTHKCWYVLNIENNRIKLGLSKLSTNETVESDKSQNYKNLIFKISNHNIEELKRYINVLELKAYSHNTIRTYRNEFIQLLEIIKEVHVDELTEEKLRSYLLYCVKTLKLKENTIHSRLNALKFYYEKVLKREKFFFEIPRPQKHQILPKTIHALDIKKLFDVTTNLKHNTMLKLCYGMGLRVSEIVNIKIVDIDSNNMQIFIEKSKNKKDRYVNLPESLLNQLRSYFIAYKPQKYLFEGQFGEKYSTRSAQQVFSNALAKAKINKVTGIHGLRHSYATHLLEQGTDITYIKQLMGHNDIKTTLIYTQVSRKSIKNIKSPLDNII